MVMTAAAPTAARDAAIDRLRIAAMLAGVAMHAAAAYMTRPVSGMPWLVHEPARSGVADVVFWWGRAAQVQLFFFIAGLVSVRAYADRGPRAFAIARLKRIGIPLSAAIVFVLPLVAAVWGYGWFASGRAAWSEVLSWQFADGEIAGNRLGPAHLWFLEDLLMLALLTAACWRAAGAKRPLRLPAGAGAILLPILIGIGVIMARPAAVLAFSNSFVPDPFRLIYGATFFAAGMSFASAGVAPASVAVGIGLAAAGGVAAVTLAAAATAAIDVSPALLALLVVSTAWLTIAAALCLAHAVRGKLSPLGSRLARASYAIYIVHLPLVGALQLLLYRRVADARLALLVVFVLSAVLAWALVEIGIAVSRRLTRPLPVPSLTPAGLTAAVVGIGVGLRLLHYLRNPDVWHDEAALLVNVVERSYGGLIGALTFNEAAPPLFLWVERAIAVGVGDSPWTLRLLPLAASCAALVAFIPLVRRLGRGAGLVALLLMACSPELVAHSVEAKPYTLDVFIATSAAAGFAATASWTLRGRSLLCLLLAPVAMLFSYPALFVVLGIIGALAFAHCRDRDPRGWALFGIAVLTCSIVAVWLVTGPAAAQRSPAIVLNWAWAFPAAYDPFAVGLWLFRSVVGLADYCFRPFGGVLLVPVAIGVAALWRFSDRALVMALTAPIVLAMLAGLAGRYPFSGSRVMIFALPALALFAAEGLRHIAAVLRDRSALLHATALALALAPPVVLSARDAVASSKRPATAEAARIVLAARRPHEFVASGNWEPRYYFRGLGDRVIRLDERPLPRGEARLWCVVHGPTAEWRRERLMAAAGDGYAVASATDLAGVSVIELEWRR
jgi:peptidoglycan/LPS O-acetylase OafA/YrhL